MARDKETVEDLPEWMLYAEYNELKSFIQLLYENQDTAFSQKEIVEKTDLDTNQLIDTLVELKSQEYIKKKGPYVIPNKIEVAYKEWENNKRYLKSESN